MSNPTRRRPAVGDRVQVTAVQSERRGERGTVTAVSPRGICTVTMDSGITESQWPSFEVKVIEERRPAQVKVTYTARIYQALPDQPGRWIVEVVKHPFNAVVEVEWFDYRDDAVTFVQESYPKALVNLT